MDYLVNKRGIKIVKGGDKIDTTEAEKLYELVGGRVVDLNKVAERFLIKQSFEGIIDFDILHKYKMNFILTFFSAEIEQQKLIEIKKKFKSAKLYKNQSYYEAGKSAIKALLDSNQEIDYMTFRRFFNNPEEANEVLETNVFAYHPAKNTVTFQSRAVEYYIRKNANIFLK